MVLFSVCEIDHHFDNLHNEKQGSSCHIHISPTFYIQYKIVSISIITSVYYFKTCGILLSLDNFLYDPEKQRPTEVITQNHSILPVVLCLLFHSMPKWGKTSCALRQYFAILFTFMNITLPSIHGKCISQCLGITRRFFFCTRPCLSCTAFLKEKIISPFSFFF